MRQSRQRCQVKFAVRVTFARGIIPFARQCTHPPGLTADIHFSVVTVGHRRKRATRSRYCLAQLRQICLMLEWKNLNLLTLVEESCLNFASNNS